MQIPALVSMRANLMLFAFAVAVSEAACLTVCAFCGRLDAMGAPAARIATLGAATVLVFLVRRAARHAYGAAEYSRHLAWTAHAHANPEIAEGCRWAWLVQLHLELNRNAVERRAHAKA
jgi:hypothetical protein